MPDKSILKNCWNNNPDGAGYMYRTGKGVIGSKGYMKQKALISALAVKERLFNGSDLVIHFRWATHGLRDHTATHPFPLSTDTKDLTKSSWKGEAGLAHNGIIANYGTKDLSDTQDFIFSDLGHFNSLADRPEVLKYLESKGGRYALMTSRKTYLIGSFLQDDGVYYSNSDYKYSIKSYKYSQGYYHKAGKEYPAGYFSGGPANTDICPLTGRISNIYDCETCHNYRWEEMSCELEGNFTSGSEKWY